MMKMTRSLSVLSLALLLTLCSTACGAPEEQGQEETSYSAEERGVLPDSGGKSDTIQVRPGEYISGIPPARFELLSIGAQPTQVLQRFRQGRIESLDALVAVTDGLLATFDER